MGVNKTTTVTTGGNTYEYITLYGDEIKHSLPDNYTDDSVTSTDYAHDHHPKSGSSEWRNQITTGLKNKYYYVMNKILQVFSEPKTETKEIDLETGEITIDYSGNDLPTSLTEPSDNTNAFDANYNNYWSVFEQFKEDKYLGSVPELYTPYASFKQNSDTYTAGSGNDMINSQYTIWNNQHKLLQHILCKNMTSYANGGFVDGVYNKERCQNVNKSNGTNANDYHSNGSNSNGSKGNGTNTNAQTCVNADGGTIACHNGTKSNGTNNRGEKSHGKHSNGIKTNGLYSNAPYTDGVVHGTCNAQGPRYINILCQKRTCSQTCPDNGAINYDEIDVTSFLASTATEYINY